ncbi:hypothetical protein NKH77_43625 [Streptomyces sp. M19]
METTPAVAFPDADILEKRLGEFLDLRGLSRDAVLKEADQGMGTPALAVAAGSVLAGFGNIRSDLDLLVLVENENLTRFPIQSHEHGTLIDVSIRRASTVRKNTAALTAEPWPRFATVTEEAWNHRRRALNTASRLALGLPLATTPTWEEWHAGCATGGSRSPCGSGGRSRRTGSRGPPAGCSTPSRSRPGYAPGRRCSPRSARAAAAGELYFAAKWAGEKLRTLGDTEGLALLRDALTLGDPRETVPRCLDAVEHVVGDAAPLHTVLRWATGAGTMELEDRTVVDRWQLRALEVRRLGLPAGDSEGVIWSGPAGTPPPRTCCRCSSTTWCGSLSPTPTRRCPRDAPQHICDRHVCDRRRCPGSADTPTDLRRLLTFRGHGAARLLLGCRSRLEDVEGAVAAGQTEVAVVMAYDLVQLSLSIRGLRTEGELTYGHDEAAFDPSPESPMTRRRPGWRSPRRAWTPRARRPRSGWSGCAATSRRPRPCSATPNRCPTCAPGAA